jgi:hypothetical protein
MTDRNTISRAAVVTAAIIISWAAPGDIRGQGRRGQAPVPVGRPSAPLDLTGYWVSLVTEDWRFRMVTPRKGDYLGVPLNAEGRRVGDIWDPAKDEASNQQCKSYGAPALTRIPGRLHITWDNDTTLKIETDAGTQTRLFHFQASAPTIITTDGGAPHLEGEAVNVAAAARAEPSLQGNSIATWEFAADEDGRPRIPRNGPVAANATPQGGLRVVTTQLRPGYLRKNGVPYSANAILTEYYERTNEDNGDSYLIVTTMVDDPQYLNARFVTSTHFKKQADASGWSPSPCTAR